MAHRNATTRGSTDAWLVAEAMEEFAETLERELAEERRKLDTILYDVDYKGGLQDWQQKHREALMAAMESAEMALKYATQNQALLAALKGLLECYHRPCRADHRGMCQEHHLDPINECRIAIARAAIAAAEPKAEGKG